MGSSRVRRIYRLQLGVNRKLTAIWRIGGATVGVVNLDSHRKKADEGAERSCRKAKCRRGQRAKCKRREGKSRSGNFVRPPTAARSSRSDHASAWEEKRATSFLERIEEVRGWEQSQKKTDAMKSIRKCFVRTRYHVEKIFGSSLSWSRFLYLTNVPVFRCNVNLSVSIIPVDPETAFKGLPIHEVTPHRLKDWMIGIDAPSNGTRFCFACGERVFIGNKRVLNRPHAEVCAARKRRKQYTLPANKTVEQDEKALRPPVRSVQSPARRCRWCHKEKGVVHGNMRCDRHPSARGHEWI